MSIIKYCVCVGLHLHINRSLEVLEVNNQDIRVEIYKRHRKGGML